MLKGGGMRGAGEGKTEEKHIRKKIKTGDSTETHREKPGSLIFGGPLWG